MPDDLDKKLKQIGDMFGISDTSGLKNIVESIAPNMNSNSNVGSFPESGPSYNTSNIPTPSGMNRNNPMDLGLLSKVNEMLGMFNNVSDSRITLLHSVQPFLGNQRQQRLSGAIQLLKILSIINSIAPNFNRNTKG
jgi:hypothetical protein